MIAVPLYPPRPNQKLDRVRDVVADCRCRIALTDSGSIASIQTLIQGEAGLTDLALHATDGLGRDTGFAPEPARVAHDPETIAFLQYTSGSTGAPKGVMVSHGNMMANMASIGSAFKTSADDVCLSWLPLYHDMGLIGTVLHALYQGFLSILMPPVAFVQDPVRWLEGVSKYRASLSGAPNFAYDVLVDRVSAARAQELAARIDLSSWRVAFNGAEPVRAETLLKFKDRFAVLGFGSNSFYPCYGMAETTLLISGGDPKQAPVIRHFSKDALAQGQAKITAQDDDAAALTGCGQPDDRHRAVVVDPEKRTRHADGEIGEIWFSGPSVTTGYWNRTTETAAAFGVALNGEGSFLRTGDLGFVHEGELFITGRLKDLIIVRGRNHYPQDIEATASACDPGLRAGFAAAFTIDTEGEPRLVLVQEADRRAARALDADAVIEKIRAAIAAEHELGVHTVLLLKQGSVPKTSSGKIRRNACRQRFLEDTFDVLGRSSRPEPTVRAAPVLLTRDLIFESDDPESLLEGHLAWLTGALLKSREPQPDEPLTSLGMDSMAAVEMQHRLETELDVKLPITQFLSGLSIRELARAALALMKANRTPIAIARADQGPFPLSPNQKALWFLSRFAPDSAAYNISFTVRVHGSLDFFAARRAFQNLIERHPAMRTVFGVADGEPFQRFLDGQELFLERADASDWEEERVIAFLEQEAGRSFDLERGPLFRVVLLQRSENEYLLSMNVHHIVSDLWSLLILMKEFGRFYASEEPNLPPLSADYADYVAALETFSREPGFADTDRFWQEYLAGPIPDLALPTDRPRPPIQTFNGARHLFCLNTDLSQALVALAQQRRTTLFTVLISIYQALLHRYSGQDRVLTGSPTNGRSARFQDLIGYFVNPLVFKAEFDDDPRFCDLLDRARADHLAIMDRQDYPFQVLVEKRQPERDPARSPLFQALFTFQNPRGIEGSGPFVLQAPGARLELGGLTLESVPLRQRTAQFDLSLIAAETQDGLACVFEYNTDLFGPGSITRLTHHFQNLAAAAAAMPETRLSLLALMSEAERQTLLLKWNATETRFEAADTIHDCFERRARRCPARIALVQDAENAPSDSARRGEVHISFAALAERADRMAVALTERGVGRGQRVAVCLKRSVDLVAVLIAALKTGAAYTPLDPDHPEERRRQILIEADPILTIADKALLDAKDSATVLGIDDLLKAPVRHRVWPTTPLDELAYIMFTYHIL